MELLIATNTVIHNISVIQMLLEEMIEINAKKWKI